MCCPTSSLLAKAAAVLAVWFALGAVPVDSKTDPEKVCAELKDKAPELYEYCKDSEVVKQKGFIPKHLRPPWLDLPKLFNDNENKDKKLDNCYACYKGKSASNENFPDEEYCACQYGGNLPNIGFGKLFGQVKFLDNGNCVDEFYKLALMPKCGNENFDHIRHCAIVHFYKNDNVSEPEGTEYKRTLVLLDGCVVGVSNECAGKVKVEFTEPSTGFFTGNCDEQVKTIFEEDFNLLKGKEPEKGKNANDTDFEADDTNVFTFPVLFQHRICSGLGSATVDNLFQQITVTIGGDGCGEAKSFKLQTPLDSSKGRVQEMRGLQFNMSDGTVWQWFDEKGSHDYSVQKGPQKWQTMKNMEDVDKYGKFIGGTY